MHGHALYDHAGTAVSRIPRRSNGSTSACSSLCSTASRAF